MNVDGKPMRPIWLDEKSGAVRIIDQRRLPHELVIMELADVSDAVLAIKEMAVRGAPLIGVTAASGVYLAVGGGAGGAGAAAPAPPTSRPHAQGGPADGRQPGLGR
jgi:hypothetical protein